MIYVITHKIIEWDKFDKEHYKVLHVGKNGNAKPDYIRDDSGDNISYKNEFYCELTGLYWIWKNAAEKGEDIVGLVHYRRFFTTKRKSFLQRYFKREPYVLDFNTIENTLKKYDIILPSKVRSYRTVRRVYNDAHIPEDIDIVRNILKIKCPEYLPSFDKVMSQHWSYYYNMLVCKKKLFDDYAKWLFDILFYMEENIDIGKYKDKYQRRIFGFVSERLLQVWALHNNLKIKEYPVFNVEQEKNFVLDKVHKINARIKARNNHR